MRKSIFDTIAEIHFHSALDLCAGSGSLGIEALSRGCDYVTFIEKNSAVARVLKNNIKRLHLDERASILIGDARSIIKGLNKADLIFIDPPYRTQLATGLLRLIYKYSILKREGIIIVESSKRNEPVFDKFRISNRRVIGETVLNYLKWA